MEEIDIDTEFNTEFNTLLKKSIQNDNAINNNIKRVILSDLIKKRAQHITWNLLHSFSVFYPENPTEQQQNNTKNLLLNIKKCMPFCMVCGNNGKDNFVETSNLDNIVSSSDNLIQFVINYHSFINKLLRNYSEVYNDEIFTVEFIKNKYRDKKYHNYIYKTYNIDFINIVLGDKYSENYLRGQMDNIRMTLLDNIKLNNYTISLNINFT